MRNELYELLMKAKGDRSIRQYAKEAGVDPSSISRIMTGEQNPSVKILQKLTNDGASPRNGVTLTDLMVAAGYGVPNVNELTMNLKIRNLISILNDVNERIPIVVKDQNENWFRLGWEYDCDEGCDDFCFHLAESQFVNNLDTDAMKMILDYEYRSPNRCRSLFNPVDFGDFDLKVSWPASGIFTKGGIWKSIPFDKAKIDIIEINGEKTKCLIFETNGVLPMLNIKTDEPWYEEKWYDKDIINAMSCAGVDPSPANVLLFKAKNMNIFDDKSYRNEMVISAIDNMRGEFKS